MSQQEPQYLGTNGLKKLYFPPARSEIPPTKKCAHVIPTVPASRPPATRAHIGISTKREESRDMVYNVVSVIAAVP